MKTYSRGLVVGKFGPLHRGQTYMLAAPFLDPRVYASFVRRIGILGGESTGKSTLA